MTTPANPTFVAPQIVYSARDFDTILAATINFIKTNFPARWQDFNASNAGVPLLEAGAYQSAILSWNLDTEIAETYLATARLKDSVLVLAGNVGYVPVGRTAAVILCDATMITPPNTVQVLLPKGTPIKSLQGEVFEVYADMIIAPGQLTPRVAVASEVDTAPRGLTLDFVAGETEIHFHLGDTAGRHSLDVEAGMYLASKGQYPDWYRIATLDTNKTILTLDRPWNAVFSGAFVIKTAGSDAASSRTIVSATPYGTFPSIATCTLNSTTVTFTVALPQTVLANQYFRLNGLKSCCGAKWFAISAVSPDYRSITLAEAFGPTVVNGFDDLNVGFLIENRSIILVNGSTRIDSFPAAAPPAGNGTTPVPTPAAPQAFRLLATPVIPASVIVTDQDGATDGEGNPLPWQRVANLSEAVFSAANYRAYQLVEVTEDSYEVRFGNGFLGKMPTGVVTVQYRVGGGPDGNVPINSFNTLVHGMRGNDTVTIQISNANAYGQGGALGEDVNSLKANIPTFYSTNSRAVTGADYVSLVLQRFPLWAGALGSVAQASVNQALNAVQYGGNVIYINIWTISQWSPPSTARAGTSYTTLVPPSAALIANVQTFLESYSMVTDVPTVLQGDVDEAIIDVDIQIEPTADSTDMRLAGEQAVMSLFNSPPVVSGNPLLLSDLYGVLENLAGVLQVRMRAVYLILEDLNQPENLSVTPSSLRTVGDLYPRSLNSIVTPGDIQVLAWSLNIGLAIYINAVLYPNTVLAEEEIRKDIENFFFDLRPGDGVYIADIENIIEKTLAGQVQTLEPARVASGVNVDIRNAEASTVLNVDGVNLKNGDRVLLWKQTDASENGVYAVAGLEKPNAPWSLLRSADAADYNTLSPGSLISITGGVTYIGVQFFYDTHNLNYATWPGGAKTFTVGNLLAAEQSLIAITTLNSTRFDAPIGDTPTFKPSLPSTVYFLKSLTIN
jgi:hypothetical protein